MKFFYVYVRYNKSRNFIYIGYSENFKKRVAEHNSGKSKSTKFYQPLSLIFYEAYKTKSDAKRREKYLKTNKGNYLNNNAQGLFQQSQKANQEHFISKAGLLGVTTLFFFGSPLHNIFPFSNIS